MHTHRLHNEHHVIELLRDDVVPQLQTQPLGEGGIGGAGVPTPPPPRVGYGWGLGEGEVAVTCRRLRRRRWRRPAGRRHRMLPCVKLASSQPQPLG